MKTNKKELLDSFKGGLIVSCQVQHDDPTFSVDFVVKTIVFFVIGWQIRLKE